MPSLKSYWLVIHVSVATLSVALFTHRLLVGVLYLVQAGSRRVAPGRARVHESPCRRPALDRTAYGLHVVAFPLWTFTLIAGAIWAEQAWGHYWNWDPKEVWTLRHLGGLRRLPARPRDHRVAAAHGVVHRARRLRLHPRQLHVVNVFFVGQHSYSGM